MADTPRAPPEAWPDGPPPALAPVPFEVPPADIDRMRRLLSTGLLKDRVRAARLGAMVARRAGYEAAPALACAAICSALLPGEGTVIGARLGSHDPVAGAG